MHNFWWFGGIRPHGDDETGKRYILGSSHVDCEQYVKIPMARRAVRVPYRKKIEGKIVVAGNFSR